MPPEPRFPRDSERRRRFPLRATLALCLLFVGGGAQDRDARRERLAALSPEGQARLLDAYQRFERLDPAEQRRLRELAAALEAHPDRDALLGVLDRYCAWLDTLSPGEQAELQALDDESARIEKMKALRERHTYRGPRLLAAADRQALIDWLHEELREKLPPSVRDELRGLPPEERRRRVLQYAWRAWQSSPTRRPPNFQTDHVQKLRETLSAEARQQLDAAPDPDARHKIIGGWLFQTFFKELGLRPGESWRPHVSDDERRAMAETFDALPPEEQDRLQRLPPDEFERQLYGRIRDKAPRPGFRPGSGRPFPFGGDGPKHFGPGRNGPLRNGSGSPPPDARSPDARPPDARPPDARPPDARPPVPGPQ